MKDHISTTMGGKKHRKTNRDNLSPDGKWRSFPKVPNLLQYVSTGTYFARLKVNGKLIRRTLHKENEPTMSFTTAQLRLGDFKNAEHKRKPVLGTFAAAREA